MGILEAIGNTSLVELNRLVPPGSARVLVKLEWENPTGSLKDRMASEVIARAEEDGRLAPGGTVVEYTGGSTGASLALVCAARGYRIRIVSSDAFSRDKLDQMAAYGAELTLVPSEGGRTTKKLILDMIEAARALAVEPGAFWVDQLENEDTIAGYFGLGEEIWSQTDGRVDAFVHSVGTAASSRGVATVLKGHSSEIHTVAVEPGESAVLSGGQPGPHKIEGVGIGYTPPLWKRELFDEVIAVSTAEAKAMARRLAREEALFAGTSSGANVVAALEVARRLGPGATLVTLLGDSGLKYLNTDVYRRGWRAVRPRHSRASSGMTPHAMDTTRLTLRTATSADTPAIAVLIDASIRGLGPQRYDARQIESSLAHLFGVDTAMIEDGTYYVVEEADGRIVGAGGWSRRRTPFGGDRAAHFRDAGLREPGRDAAVIRAFYVHPDRARRGIGRMLMEASEGAARAEGYTRFELVATLTGIPLYAAFGYQEGEPVRIPLPDGVVIEAVWMERADPPSGRPADT